MSRIDWDSRDRIEDIDNAPKHSFFIQGYRIDAWFDYEKGSFKAPMIEHETDLMDTLLNEYKGWQCDQLTLMRILYDVEIYYQTNKYVAPPELLDKIADVIIKYADSKYNPEGNNNVP